MARGRIGRAMQASERNARMIRLAGIVNSLPQRMAARRAGENLRRIQTWTQRVISFNAERKLAEIIKYK